MRKALLGVLTAIWATSSLGASLAVESGAYGVYAPLPALNTFVRLANQTILFVNERMDEPVRPLAKMEGGPGLRLSERFGEFVQLGAQLALAEVSTQTAGTWKNGVQEHPVRLELSAGLTTLEAEAVLVLVPEIVHVGLFGGVGVGQVRYWGEFPPTLPTEWSLPFLPRSENQTYTVRGWVGGAFARLTWPISRGVALGVEAAVRFARLGVPQSADAVLDLNADGLGDILDFTSLWLGLVVRISFPL